jgi:hypothetical protein
MTRIELLKKYYDMACHNLLCYSRNYAMTVPKEGFEVEWKQVNEECELLQEMIKQYEVAQQKETASPKKAAKEIVNEYKQKLDELKKSSYTFDVYPFLLKAINESRVIVENNGSNEGF